MRAAAYCFVCSISDPGIPEALPSRAPDLRTSNDRRLAWPLVIVLVAAGSVFGIPSIFLSETIAGVLAAVISAPVVEELFKPFGVYILIARWPGTVRRQTSIAALAGLSGLAFGLMESALYVFVYQPSGVGESYVLVRFTIPVALHVIASTLFGFGVNRQAFRALARGNLPEKRSWIFIMSAMLLHAGYNIFVTVFAYL
jgi:RsiW-degrading membrane proteinase PrsW (M82 family)